MTTRRAFVGLDLGQHCGWAILLPSGDRLGSGTWDLGPSDAERRAKRLGLWNYRAFKTIDHAMAVLARQGYQPVLAVEKVWHHSAIDAAHSYGFLLGVARIVAERIESDCHEFTPGEVKVAGCGKGNASKLDMVYAAKERYGLAECGEDEADALAVAAACRMRCMGRLK